jgi:hypothetical protein
MNRKYNFLVLSLVLGGMLTVLSGMPTAHSSEGKNVQCQRFIEVNRKIKNSLAVNEALGQSLNRRTKNLEEFRQLAKDFSKFFTQSANSLDKAVRLINNLSVQDGNLKTLKTEYLAVIRQTRDATRELVNIADAQSRITEQDLKRRSAQRLGAEFREAIQSLHDAGKREEVLINRLNAYCGTKLQ